MRAVWLSVILVAGCGAQANKAKPDAVPEAPAAAAPGPASASGDPFAAPVAPPARPQPGPDLIAAASRAYGFDFPGQAHADEHVAKDGELWLGLIGARSDAPRLIWGDARVELVHDEITDGAGEATGEYLRFTPYDSVAEPPDYMLRGPKLTAGAARKAVIGRPEGGEAEGKVEVPILLEGAPAARLLVTVDPNPVSGGRLCYYTLESGGRYAVLAGAEGAMDAVCPGDEEPRDPFDWGEYVANLISFAGDLDGDGRLDLIFSPPVHYNVGAVGLFLSGAATGGEPVGRAGTSRRTGC